MKIDMAPLPTAGEAEKRLIKAINSNILEDVQRIVTEPGIRVESLDENGMTPLQHAAYRGNKEMCKLLLSHGADVNANYHEHGYTTLMFGSLSGNEPVIQLLLESGAKTSLTNNVNRTASQMAAFVGQHRAVSLINNFFSREKLDYYTIPQGFEKEPKLRPELAPSLHKFVLNQNLNPVKSVIFLRDHPELVDNPKEINRVLDLIIEKEYTTSECNEVLSLKTHYFMEIFKACVKKREEDPKFETFLKSLLRSRESDGMQVGMEKFIRDAIKPYFYVESTLFQHLVRQLATNKDACALNVLSAIINGPLNNPDDDKSCDTCGEANSKKKCSNCKMVSYCEQACQKLHWFSHKKFCKRLAEQYVLVQEAEKQRKELEEAEQQKKAAEEQIAKLAAEAEARHKAVEEKEREVKDKEATLAHLASSIIDPESQKPNGDGVKISKDKESSIKNTANGDGGTIIENLEKAKITEDTKS